MPTKLVRSLYNLTPADQGGVVTIGNFDGVHLGHQALLKAVRDSARQRGVIAVAVTFEPHPFEYFGREHLTIPRITRLREKFMALSDCGIDRVVILKFNQSLADISASDFATEILYRRLRPAEMIMGDDFRFGRKREGDFTFLQGIGQQFGFAVKAMPTLTIGGERVSSTRVRQALAMGDHHLVRQLLGRPYAMQGRVRHGDQRGREWGFPTANIFLHRRLTPVKGVYHVLVHGLADYPWPGVANVGTRPTVDGTRTLLEVHLHDFDQMIYGRYVSVEFCEKVRDEIRYADVGQLKAQIANDVALSRDYFRKQGKL